jgi:hypothetical protein
MNYSRSWQNDQGHWEQSCLWLESSRSNVRMTRLILIFLRHSKQISVLWTGIHWSVPSCRFSLKRRFGSYLYVHNQDDKGYESQRSALFWDITYRRIVVSTDVMGQLISPPFRGQALRWDRRVVPKRRQESTIVRYVKFRNNGSLRLRIFWNLVCRIP